MSRFYGSLQGNRGEVTRGGSKRSGIRGHIRGWNVGVKVVCSFDFENMRDVCRVYKTGGSTGATPEDFICEVTKDSQFTDPR